MVPYGHIYPIYFEVTKLVIKVNKNTKLQSDNQLPEKVATPELEEQSTEQQERVDATALEIATKRLKRHAKTWEELAKY